MAELAVEARAKAASAPPSSRDRILAASVQVALRDGVSAMTLEAVAREAGVSKGGLLYHFASKDELIAAMSQHHAGRIQKTVEARMAADPNPRGRWFRALVQTIHGCGGGDPVMAEMPRFMIAMLAASATNPQLLDPIRERLKAVREHLLEEGPNGVRQVALWPAIFGLMLWRHLGVLADDDPVRQAIVEELLGLAEGPGPISFHRSDSMAATAEMTEPTQAGAALRCAARIGRRDCAGFGSGCCCRRSPPEGPGARRESRRCCGPRSSRSSRGRFRSA